MEDELYEAVRKAFNRWHQLEQDAPAILLGWANEAGNELRPLLAEKLHALEDDNKDAAIVLHKRFIDEMPALQIATADTISEDSVYRKQRNGLRRIAEWIQRDIVNSRRRLEDHLQPASYTQLFGATAWVNALEAQLLSAAAPHLTLVGGIGGIGKTAVTDASVRAVVRRGQFEHVVWMRYESLTMSGASPNPQAAFEQLMVELAQQPHIQATRLTQRQRDNHIREALKTTTHLIVIDNIEEVADATYLLERLPHFVAPSHIVITTRAQPVGQTVAYPINLEELALEDAAALLRYQARQGNLDVLATASANEIAQLVALTGGNPLAINLLVGLARKMTLAQLQQELTASQTRQTSALYGRIYERAWAQLDVTAQTVLKCMLMSAENGTTFEHLQTLSKADNAALWSAIDELLAHSLLETRGSLTERRFGIHRLTRLFLSSRFMD